MRAAAVLLAAATVATALPPLSAPLAQARSADCEDAGARGPRELPLVLPDGTRLRVRDGAGGVLSAPTFRFVLRGSAADLEKAGTVRWYLDDRRVARTSTPPYPWRGRTARLREGRRTVTVQAEVRDGVVATTSFTIRVVRCG